MIIIIIISSSFLWWFYQCKLRYTVQQPVNRDSADFLRSDARWRPLPQMVINNVVRAGSVLRLRAGVVRNDGRHLNDIIIWFRLTIEDGSSSELNELD